MSRLVGHSTSIWISTHSLRDHLDEIERPRTDYCHLCWSAVRRLKTQKAANPTTVREHQSDTTCSSCGKEVASSEQLLDERGRCQKCQPDESWEASKKMMSASRAFSEVRRDAESKAGTDRTPLLEEVTIQVGGDEPFKRPSSSVSDPDSKPAKTR